MPGCIRSKRLAVCALLLSMATTAVSQEDASRSRGRGPRPGGRPAPGPVVHDPTGFIPLTELGQRQYRGLDGGLYGQGRNEPPEAHQVLARAALAKIRPLDASGMPAADGKVVLISIGM